MTTVAVSGGQLDMVQKVGSVENMKKLETVGTIERIESVSIAAYPCPKINNSGVTASWDWKSAGLTAIALINTAAAYTIAQKQYDTAKRYWALARERWDYFQDTYKPCEVNEVLETTTTPRPTADYDAAASVYRTGTDLAFSKAQNEIKRAYGVYCLCPDSAVLRDINLVRTQMEVDGVNFGYRRAEARAEALDDLLFNRKVGIVSRGRGILSESAGYARAFVDMYDQFGRTVSAAAGGAIGGLNYMMGRRNAEATLSNIRGGYQGFSTPQSAHDPVGDIINSSTISTTPDGVYPQIGAAEEYGDISSELGTTVTQSYVER